MDGAAPPLPVNNNNLTSDGDVDRSSSPTAPDVAIQHGSRTGRERVCWASQSSSGLVVVTNEKQLAASETGTKLEAPARSLPLSKEQFNAALCSDGDTPEGHASPLDATQLAGADIDLNPSSADSEEINQTGEDVLNDATEMHVVNSVDAVERVEALVETHLEEILDAQKVKSGLSGLEQTASSLQMAPASPNPPATPPLFDAGLVVSLQAGEVVGSETSDASEQVLAELVHAAAGAQEIVVVREEAHISGEWSDVHLNRGYLLQRQDGSVCQAAIQLATGDTKLYHSGVEAEVELDAQPMEVYEFCELVEEVAEETVCASSGGGGVVQLPQSPEYEVNLFDALLENADEFTVKEDVEGGNAIIISQQPSADGVDPPISDDLSNRSSSMAVGRHLLLDANQTVRVAHGTEVCLVQVAALTSDSFADGHTDSGEQTGISSSPGAAVPDESESLLDSSERHDEATEPGSTFQIISAVEDGTVSAAINASVTQTPPLINQTPGVTVLGGESEVRLSLPEGKEESPTAADGVARSVLDPTLLLKPSEAPPLKPSPSPLAVATNQTSAAPEECLTRPVPPSSSVFSSSEPLSCQPDTTLTSVTRSSTARTPLQQTSAALTQTSKTPRGAKPEDGGPSDDTAGPADDLYEEEEDDEEEEEEEEDEEASSPEEEEGSDEEAENDKSEMRSQRSSLQVRKWMADRAGVNSSPVSPSSSSSSYPGPSAASDWSATRREKSSPLRGANGKFVSPSSICGYSPAASAASSSNEPATTPRPRGERHTDMAELAKHEADIELRTQALKREGFWALKRLGRLTEPPRPKVHWDYLCEEMQWLSADFAQERRWKRGVARKVVRMVMRHHEELRQKEEKAKRDEHAKIRRVASSIAKEVRAFWSSVEKVVQYKQQSRLEEKRKKALDLQLDFIVGQTEKYSHLLTKSLNPSRLPESATTPSPKPPPPQDEDDGDFAPPVEEEEDDEETIEVEEQQEGNDAESRRREIQLLKEEGLLPLDQLLSTLKLPPQKECEEEEEDSSDGTASTLPEEEEDGEFTANDEDAEDEEDTIAAQEKMEGDVNHTEELDDLAREGDLSLEELLEKYRGAFGSSDPEAPSGCGSKSSSDQEDSGEEEEETEEDESDVETNSSSSDSAGDSADEEESEKDEGASEEEEEEEECDEGMEVLLKEGDNSPPSSRPKKEISHIAATAESLQPKGYTLATTKVKTPIPFLLHGTLREYQHIGLEWLVTMYEKKLNGILADEMGLGKTIQTIALLAHLACEKVNWGPHLIIVPTSVMLNWEMELKRWCPGFKILTYFGSQKERKLKRQGWTKPNAFHVCITSYKLVLQDHQAFRRKSWRYLILDEAQNIKNFKSQRWQSLLNFNSHRRLLLTGTPLQNSLMELWSLMHFLMPHVFQSHREFKEWFSNPLTGMIEGSQEYNEGLVKRLHKVLRPFLLRRIKIDVEKQMPKKYEHVVRCRLSKRQRFLYDDFMAQASTRETLASGHFMSVINILMQLRKVCNHPNLFDPRPIQSPFITKPIVFLTASLVQDALDVEPLKRCDLSIFDLVGLERRVSRYQADVFLPRHAVTRQLIQDISDSPEPPPRPRPVRMKVNRMFQPPPKGEPRPVLLMNKPLSSAPTQTPKPPPAPPPPAPPLSEVASTPPQPAPVVQQVVCTVASSPSPRLPQSATQTAVRSSAPKPLLATCTPTIPAHPGPNPTAVMPQRVLLSPDMQARLPSGEVVSIAQLASLAGRPVSSCQGSKPVTFQLQGNKLTLSGAHIHQVPAAPQRTLPGNVMHLVSSGVQHHLITQPAQVSVQNAAAVRPAVATAPPTNRLPLNVSSPAPPSMVSTPGVVKIVVRQSSGKEGRPVPTLAMAPPPRIAPPPHPAPLPARPQQMAQRATATAHYTLAPPRTPAQPPQPRPLLKVVQPPHPPLPPPSGGEPAASSQVTSSSSSSSSVSKSLAPLQNAAPAAAASKPRPVTAAKTCPPPRKMPRPPPRSPFHMPWLSSSFQQQRRSRLDFLFSVNQRRCGRAPVYGREVLDFLTFLPSPRPSPAATWREEEEGKEREGRGEGWWRRSGHSSCLLARQQDEHQNYWRRSDAVANAILTAQERLDLLTELVDRFTFVIPPVEAPPLSMHCCHPPPSLSHRQAVFSSMLASRAAPLLTRSLHRIQCYMRTQFPDLRLIQYDCGKLQVLHTLLRKLKTGGHRVLIFTQMTRMLDVLEQFLNYHGHIYLRLDGSTRVEQRQALMERFNADRRIFCFILSTRSGGVGVNLTGADTVVFYDSDWNPTMDAQAQDRCHRIGQTRDVHIYRLISERTVEENILKKANQKRMLGDMAIEGGNFTTAFFQQQTIRELFDMSDGEKREAAVELSLPPVEEEGGNKQSTTILEQALCRAEDEEDIVAASQAKAEQVAELAEFNENIPLDDGGEPEEAEELSKAEQEIAALVEQLTPIERYAMNFLEASLEDVCKEELKQAEEQVEAARKGLDQAKEEGLKLHASSDDEDFLSTPSSAEPGQQLPRRGRKPKDKMAASTRTSGRLRGASPETEPEPTPTREPERLRSGLRGRGAAKTPGAAAANPPKASSTRLQETNKSSKATSPSRDQHAIKTRTNRTQPSQVTSGTAAMATDSRRGVREEEKERRSQESLLESAASDLQSKDEDSKDAAAMSPPSTRSPRKRQSADGEVLRGLVEDSPSAKVLRKLPGRLVTVVEEKEPRRRRRRASGTGGGSSEEAVVEDNGEELNKDATSSDAKTTATKPPQEQDSAPSVAAPPLPVRSYPPYSPPHLAPDMPVLRNLPVRRRLETESRMAAQLGEQLRGRAGSQSKKADTVPGRDATSTESNLNSLVTPLKRKRGRPPKTPLRSPESDHTVTPSPTSPSEDGTPTLSPKRRRGRPLKDSLTMSDAGEGLDSEGSAPPELAMLPASTSETPLPPAIAAASQHRDSEGTSRGADSPPASDAATEEKEIEAIKSVSAPSADLATPAAPALVTPIVATPAVPAVTTPALSTPSLPPAPPPCETVATSSAPDASSTSSVAPSPGAALTVTAAASTVPTLLVSGVEPTDLAVKTSVLNSEFVHTPAAAATPGVAMEDSSPEPQATTTTASTAASITLASSTTVKSALSTTITAPGNSTPTSLASTAAAAIQTLSSTQASSGSPKPVSSVAASLAPVKTAQANETTSTPVRAVLASSPNSNALKTHQASVAVATSEKSSTSFSATNVNVLDPTAAAKATEAPPISAPPPTAEAPAPIGAPAEPLESLATSVAPPTPTSSVAPPTPTNTLSVTTVEDTKTISKESTETHQLPSLSPPTTKEESEQTPPPDKTVTAASPTVSTASSPRRVESTSSGSAAIVPTHTVPLPESVTPTTSSSSSVQQLADPISTAAVTSTLAAAAPSEKESENDNKCEPQMEAESEEAMSRKKKSSEDEADASQPKRRKTASSSLTKSDGGETKAAAITPKDDAKVRESSVEGLKRPISRQSSRESTRSSSPSSGCSSTLTRYAHHKRTYENRHPTKKRPADATSETGKEEKEDMREEGGNEEATNTSRRRRRSSSCCSSDSDSNGSGGEELRLTRSAKRRLQDQERESAKEKMLQPLSSADRNTTSNAIQSPDVDEPGGEAVRLTRKSAGSQLPQEAKPQTNSAPPPPPEPEVLGKRCSALNAAAKLLAMKGRVDTPGHTPRKDSGSKATAEKNQNTKSKSAPATPQTKVVSLTNSKPSGAKPSSSNQTSRPASRSTRQCPGSLVPPLDLEYRRSKPEDRSAAKSGEGEVASSSRGHSASSSDGEGGGGGGRSSRSRSSSNSSQRTLSSQNTERRGSRATSSGSERDRDRSLERARREGRSYRESRRSQKFLPEVAAAGGGSLGAEGTPDRVLRSVAALAAVQARSPAASTRSSASQQRHNKT